MTQSNATTMPERDAMAEFDVDAFFEQQAGDFAAIKPHIPANHPAWCTEIHNEGPEAVDHDDRDQPQVTRFHRCTVVEVEHIGVDPINDAAVFSPMAVDLEQVEHVAADGRVVLRPVALVISEVDGTDLSAVDATKLAAALLAGVDRLRDLS